MFVPTITQWSCEIPRLAGKRLAHGSGSAGLRHDAPPDTPYPQQYRMKLAPRHRLAARKYHRGNLADVADWRSRLATT